MSRFHLARLLWPPLGVIAGVDVDVPVARAGEFESIPIRVALDAFLIENVNCRAHQVRVPGHPIMGRRGLAGDGLVGEAVGFAADAADVDLPGTQHVLVGAIVAVAGLMGVLRLPLAGVVRRAFGRVSKASLRHGGRRE